MMKLAALSAILTLALPAFGANGPGSSVSEQAIRKLVADFATARNAFDADAMSRLYADDAEYIAFGQPLARGRAAIKTVWSGIRADRTARAERIIRSIHFIRPDVAVVQIDVTYAGLTLDSLHTNVHFIDTFVVAKRRRQWQIVAHESVIPDPERKRIEQLQSGNLSAAPEKTLLPAPELRRPASAPSDPTRAN